MSMVDSRLKAFTQSALLLEDKALRVHLTCLITSLDSQRKEMKIMSHLILKDFSAEKSWSGGLLSHERLVKCISLFLKSRTPLTYMHAAIVSRLSVSHQHNLLATRYDYNEKMKKQYLYVAEGSQKSAKYLAYAMLADRSGDFALRDWCLKAADALQAVLSEEQHNSFHDRGRPYLRLYSSQVSKSEEAACKGHSTVASAHLLLARHYKMLAALAVYGFDIYDDHENKYKYDTRWADQHGDQCTKMLDAVERLYQHGKMRAAETLAYFVLKYARVDDIHVEEEYKNRAHLFRFAESYVLAIDTPIPEVYQANFDRDLPHQLWSRALNLPRNEFSEKLVEYAAQIQLTLVKIATQVVLCKKQASVNSVARHSTCVDLWIHIHGCIDVVGHMLLDTGLLLRDSQNGIGCSSWQVLKTNIDDIDRWIKAATLLDEIYVQLDTYKAHRGNCMRLSQALPTIVRTTIEDFWNTAENILVDSAHEFETTLLLNGNFSCPDLTESANRLERHFGHLRAKSRFFALLAHALLVESTRYMDAASGAQALGAVEVADLYTQLMSVAVDFHKVKVTHLASHSNAVVYSKRLPFEEREMDVLNITCNHLEKAVDFFQTLNITGGSRSARILWREVYDQQLLISANSMINRHCDASHEAMRLLLLEIERISNPSTHPLHNTVQELACRLAVSVTKPEGKNAYWLAKARDACAQACESIPNEVNFYEQGLVLVVTRLHCAAMCYEALASTTSIEYVLSEPLLISAKLLSYTTKSYGLYGTICSYEQGLSFLNNIAVAVLADTTHAHLVDSLFGTFDTLTEHLCVHAATLLQYIKMEVNCSAIVAAAKRENDQQEMRLWEEVVSELRALQEVMYKQVLHILCPAITNVESECHEHRLRVERLEMAAHAYDNGETIVSHCYEMASVTSVGTRQREKHAACMQNYLGIIETAAADHPVLTALKVSAADRFRDLTDKNINRRAEDVLLQLWHAADTLVKAHIAGEAGNLEQQASLEEASALFVQSAEKWQAAEQSYGQQKIDHKREAEESKKKASNIVSSFCGHAAARQRNRNRKKK